MNLSPTKEKGVLYIEGFFPPHVHAYQTTRQGGGSQPPFDGFNLGAHVGDMAESVDANRILFQRFFPRDLSWLTQVHGVDVARLDRGAGGSDKFPDLPSKLADRRADAAITSTVDEPCVVMTADCLPILFYSDIHEQVGAIHVGWRGLCGGVIQAVLHELFQPMSLRPKKHKSEALDFYFWFGPCIGGEAFEVGSDVKAQFLEAYPDVEGFFTASSRMPDRWLCDLYGMSIAMIKQTISLSDVPHAVLHFSDRPECTFMNPEKYFSYRRDKTTGRMASGIFFSHRSDCHDSQCV